MLIGQILTTLVIALGLVAAYFVCKYKKIEINNNIFKIVSGVLAVVFFFRYMLGSEALEGVFKLTETKLNYKALDLSPALRALSFFAHWTLLTANMMVILYPFFKNSK